MIIAAIDNLVIKLLQLSAYLRISEQLLDNKVRIRLVHTEESVGKRFHERYGLRAGHTAGALLEVDGEPSVDHVGEQFIDWDNEERPVAHCNSESQKNRNKNDWHAR